MRILKTALVICFLLAPVSPSVMKRIAALTAQTSNASVEAATVPAEKKRAPVDPAKYVGSESCAECHGAEARIVDVGRQRQCLVGWADGANHKAAAAVAGACRVGDRLQVCHYIRNDLERAAAANEADQGRADVTFGFHTAVQTVTEAIDRLRDPAAKVSSLMAVPVSR